MKYPGILHRINYCKGKRTDFAASALIYNCILQETHVLKSQQKCRKHSMTTHVSHTSFLCVVIADLRQVWFGLMKWLGWGFGTDAYDD